jgi:MoaA/NifB/PqqE/SkfB family radical SAM enzyme
MKIKRLNLLLTYRCTSQCRHCCYFCGLEGKGLMTASQVNAYLLTLKEHPLESLWIYGGEPFLYPRILTEMVKIARRKGIPEIGVLTNGYWAKRRKYAFKRLQKLREAGITAMIVSTDGFHAEGVTPELAIRAGQMALDAGIEDVGYSVTFLPPRGSSNPYNELSEEIWDRLEHLNGSFLREDSVTTTGRAAESLLEHYRLKRPRRKSVCRPPDYIGGSWDELHGLEIDPHGWIMICPGLSLGNVGDRPLSELLQWYAEDGNVLWQSLRENGAFGLLDLALDRGYRPRSRYADICHMCYHVRKYLQPYFQANLAPIDCYREPSEANRRIR